MSRTTKAPARAKSAARSPVTTSTPRRAERPKARPRTSTPGGGR